MDNVCQQIELLEIRKQKVKIMKMNNDSAIKRYE